MRVSIWAMLAVAVGLMTAPTRAQTYDPRFPVCLKVRDGEGGYNDCSYSYAAAVRRVWLPDAPRNAWPTHFLRPADGARGAVRSSRRVN